MELKEISNKLRKCWNLDGDVVAINCRWSRSRDITKEWPQRKVTQKPEMQVLIMAEPCGINAKFHGPFLQYTDCCKGKFVNKRDYPYFSRFSAHWKLNIQTNTVKCKFSVKFDCLPMEISPEICKMCILISATYCTSAGLCFTNFIACVRHMLRSLSKVQLFTLQRARENTNTVV